MSVRGACVTTITIDFRGFGVFGFYWKDRVRSRQSGGQRKP